MKSKQIVRALLKKMPDDVTLAEIIPWVDIEELIGTRSAEYAAEAEHDLAAFFSKKRRDARRSRRTKDGSAKKKVLDLLSKLPNEVGLGEILNRLVLLRQLEIGLEESE